MSELQSITFPKDKFSLSFAKSWLKSNNYKDYGVDETKSRYRFRQQDPVYPADYYTKTLDNGIQLIFFNS